MVFVIGNDYLLSQDNESTLNCDGDHTVDPYNACQQPDAEDGKEPGIQFKVWLELSCSSSANDTVALEAYAFLSKEEGNATVTVRVCCVYTWWRGQSGALPLARCLCPPCCLLVAEVGLASPPPLLPLPQVTDWQQIPLPGVGQ